MWIPSKQYHLFFYQNAYKVSNRHTGDRAGHKEGILYIWAETQRHLTIVHVEDFNFSMSPLA